MKNARVYQLLEFVGAGGDDATQTSMIEAWI